MLYLTSAPKLALLSPTPKPSSNVNRIQNTKNGSENMKRKNLMDPLSSTKIEISMITVFSSAENNFVGDPVSHKKGLKNDAATARKNLDVTLAGVVSKSPKSN